ncbi:hypothetical protein PPTG_22386 [Phytophthora nicotianae INRA-310]|uniref:Uncharacterized protein n=1 Tax=Phytophthora nicotianae (strain INRA-310) TaxID=761204 RepID=W2QJB3_PHYN3|nr:hypothetical protein PPTG_22386 [Phytophthora nicotianae INRA-310]ETN12664.1 hypothetical protein PPTG_22386 [Phytophthora nicotianae INRA-310]
MADPIYLDPLDKPRKITTADIEGFELWRKFTTVIILEESVRFRGDPEWGEGCRLARLGQWTSAFIDLINSRVIDHGEGHQREHQGHSKPHITIGADVVIVTPENATRLVINNAFVTETAVMLPTDVYPVRVVTNFKGALNGLSCNDVRYVLSLPDNRFGRMVQYLDLVHGMPVQITQILRRQKELRMALSVVSRQCTFPPGMCFRLVRHGATNTIVQLPNQPPDYAILRVPNRPHATAIRPELDPELFPVFYATEAFQKVTITLPKAPNSRARAITVKLQQLPFVCAIGSARNTFVQ